MQISPLKPETPYLLFQVSHNNLPNQDSSLNFYPDKNKRLFKSSRKRNLKAFMLEIRIKNQRFPDFYRKMFAPA